MHLHGFVRIEVLLEGGGCAFGTGYRIRRDRILTAAHVIEGGDTANVFFGEDSQDGFPATVIWPGAEGLDVALLEIAADVGTAIPDASLATAPLAEDGQWRSRGFPLAGELRKLTGLNGDAFAFVASAAELEVLIKAPPVDVSDWTGISGAPVFVGNRLLGVLKSAPIRYGGERLYATPACRLMDAKGFQEKLEGARYSVNLPRVTALEERLAKHLSKAEVARASLIEARRAVGNSDWKDAWGEKGVAGLARAIVVTPVPDLLETLDLAHEDLAEPLEGEPSFQGAEDVFGVYSLAVPILFDAGLSYEIDDSAGAALVRLPITHQTLAELVMAGRDHRVPRFGDLAAPSSQPPLRACLPAFEDVGIDPTGDVRFRRFLESVVNLTDLHDGRSLLLDEQKRDLADPQLPDLERERLMVELVNTKFKTIAESRRQPMRFYLVVKKSTSILHEAVLRQIQRRLNQIVVVELGGGNMLGEGKLLEHLNALLFRQQKVRKGRP